jgi:hypothetical protein
MIKAATVVLGSVLVLMACPAGAQQPEQDILEPCVVVPKDLSGCVWALTLTVANLQGRNERLARISHRG